MFYRRWPLLGLGFFRGKMNFSLFPTLSALFSDKSSSFYPIIEQPIPPILIWCFNFLLFQTQAILGLHYTKWYLIIQGMFDCTSQFDLICFNCLYLLSYLPAFSQFAIYRPLILPSHRRKRKGSYSQPSSSQLSKRAKWKKKKTSQPLPSLFYVISKHPFGDLNVA